MSLLLETTLGDLVIDLDLEGSPELCKNVLKLAKARYYTSTLVYNVQPNRFCQLGDPHGDGSGGACIHALLSTLQEHGTLDDKLVVNSHNRFLKSNMGRPLRPEECQQKGRVVATEMQGIPDTIGSQLLITTCQGNDMALDGYQPSSSSAATTAAVGTNSEETPVFRSVGVVVEDDNDVLGKIGTTYCDATGRPYADIRVIRALVIDDPFEDLVGMDKLLKARGVVISTEPSASNGNTEDEEGDWEDLVTASPTYDRPPEETVEIRISADQIDALPGEQDPELLRQQEEELLKREDKSRAVVLEMLGDLPDADITAPENVLFVCKLNPVTEDEDLELIFSRFDENVKAEIIRDHETGSSLQYAFVEFSKKEQAVEAYFKMNNALVDDRRIKVDFSQSVAKVWNKFTQRTKSGDKGKHSNQHMPKDPFSDNNRPGGRNNASHRPHGMQRNRPGNFPRHDAASRNGPRSNQYRNDSDRYNDRNRSERHYAADNNKNRPRHRDNDDRGINDNKNNSSSNNNNNNNNSSKYDDHRDRSRRRDRDREESRRDDRGRRHDDDDNGSTNPDDRREKRRREHRSESRRERKHHRRHRDDSAGSEDDDSVRGDRSSERRKHKRRHRDREDDDDGRERRRHRSESEDEGERKSHRSSREDRKKSHRKHSHRDRDSRRHHDHKERRSRDHDDYR